MTPDKWREVQAVFASVIEADPVSREQRLRELCHGDEELHREVSTLLAADSEASALIRSPVDAIVESVEKPVPVGARVGEYEIRSLLGRGGMGTVYAGIHPVIGKEVAIKVLDPRLASSDGIVERFVREARAVNKIRHPNIIDIFAFGRSPELGHYFVMPRLHGETLGARVERASLSLAELLPIIEQIADALDAAHAAGVLHRDLKPDNVFLVADRRGSVNVQILDFGIAKLLDSGASVTRSGTQMGTPLFMSPEQWDAGEVDQRTDVYALGVMVHYALTGRFPFESSSPVALMNMHANQVPTPASEHGAPAGVDAVIAAALAKAREDRPASAGRFHAELVAAAGPAKVSSPSVATSAAPSTRAAPVAPIANTTLSASVGSIDRPASRRGRMVLGVLGLLVMGVAVVVAAVTFGTRDEPTPATNGIADPVDNDRGGSAVAPASVDAALPSPVPVPQVVLDAGVSGPPSRDDAGVRSKPRSDARVVTPRTASDAAVAPIDAGARPSDASEWGTTINPFPGQP